MIGSNINLFHRCSQDNKNSVRPEHNGCEQIAEAAVQIAGGKGHVFFQSGFKWDHINIYSLSRKQAFFLGHIERQSLDNGQRPEFYLIFVGMHKTGWPQDGCRQNKQYDYKHA